MLEEEFHELQCHDEFSCVKVLMKAACTRRPILENKQ